MRGRRKEVRERSEGVEKGSQGGSEGVEKGGGRGELLCRAR